MKSDTHSQIKELLLQNTEVMFYDQSIELIKDSKKVFVFLLWSLFTYCYNVFGKLYLSQNTNKLGGIDCNTLLLTTLQMLAGSVLYLCLLLTKQVNTTF